MSMVGLGIVGIYNVISSVTLEQIYTRAAVLVLTNVVMAPKETVLIFFVLGSTWHWTEIISSV